MSVVKSNKEFQRMKDNITKKLDNFIKSYDGFSRSVSPNNWRTSGSYYSKFIDLKHDIQNFQPITNKELEQEWVRDAIMTDEEKELYNNSKKYNL
jgi:hypothetical protein